MEKWLQQRLTPAKAKEARWIELAEVLEKLWVERFDPDLSRLERLRSSYLADDSDLVKRIREMGDYFSFEFPKETDRPTALAWRRLEIEYKDMELILRSVFRRHFGDFPVTWFPIFAPLDKPYGEGFIIGDYLRDEWKKNVPDDGYFLTSRGVVGVDKVGLYRDGLSKDVFRNEAYPLVIRTKPLHIVFDGFLWFIRHELGPYETAIDATWEANDFPELQFGPLGARYDYTAADERRLDIDLFQSVSEIERPVVFDFLDPFNVPWRLDAFLPQGFGDILPIDLVMRGTEGKVFSPFRLIWDENIWTPTVSDFEKIKAKVLVEEIDRPYAAIGVEKTKTDFALITDRRTPVIFQDKRPARLDMFYPDGFSNWLPEDTTYTFRDCNEVDLLSPLHVPFAETARANRIFPVKGQITGEKERDNDFALELAHIPVAYAHTKDREQNAIDAFFQDEIPLDKLPCFDSISADFAPLDYPFGGYV